jgi:uncharacterized protein DUF930
MSSPDPGEGMPENTAAKDRRMVVTAGVSALVHLLVLGVLFLPVLPLATPGGPEAVAVDIVTSKELASLESAASSSAPASLQPPSSEASSEASSRAPAPLPSGGSPSSSTSAQPPPPPPAPKASTASTPSSGEPASRAPSSARLVIPVGSAESSSEAQSSGLTSSDGTSSEASENIASSQADTASSASADTTPTALAAGDSADGLAPASDAQTAGASSASALEAGKPPKPVGGGSLHPATAFYLKEMLRAPGLAQAKATLKTLSPERRLAQTCNIEAYGQAGHAGYQPDAIIANAFAPVTSAGSTYTASGGAFRSEGNWYRIAYQCVLTRDMSDVVSFSFHIGADVSAEMTARLSGG